MGWSFLAVSAKSRFGLIKRGNHQRFSPVGEHPPRGRAHACCLAGIAKILPKGDYHIASEHSQTEHETHTLAWGYRIMSLIAIKLNPRKTHDC